MVVVRRKGCIVRPTRHENNINDKNTYSRQHKELLSRSIIDYKLQTTYRSLYDSLSDGTASKAGVILESGAHEGWR